MWSHMKPPDIKFDRVIHGEIEKFYPSAKQFNVTSHTPIDELYEQNLW